MQEFPVPFFEVVFPMVKELGSGFPSRISTLLSRLEDSVLLNEEVEIEVEESQNIKLEKQVEIRILNKDIEIIH